MYLSRLAKFSLRIILVALVFTGAILNYAHGSTNSRCAVLFLPSHSILQKTKQYGQEIINTKGRRLFLKNTEGDRSKDKWYGLLRKQEFNINSGQSSYLRSILTYLPRKVGGLLARNKDYQFSPLNGLYNITLRNPVEFLTRRLVGTKYEPAFFFKFPLVLTLSIGMYLGADAIYQARLQNHINAEITQHSEQYMHVIKSDFRYNKIRIALKNNEITKEEAHREAYMISLAYSQYFQYRDAHQSKRTLQSEMKLLDHYLFSYLKPVIEKGVQKANGYMVPERSLGKLSKQKILSLFQHAHLRYLKYQIIIEMLKDSELFDMMKNDSKFSKLIYRIENDPFTVSLISLYQKGKISKDELQRYLQEDAYWQNRFQDWKTIGVTRLKTEDGQYINEPLTINDIRKEIFNEINQN